MSAFAHALHSFRSGQLTQEELLSEIYRELTVEKVSPVLLLDILELQQLAQPLPGGAHEAILNRITNWPQDPTILTGAAADQGQDPRPTPGVGDILQGRFSLVELIGDGGMSRVFKAIDLRRVEAGASDPHVAVKVLTEPFNEYFGSLAALQREAHKLENLTHANIVRVMDCDRDGQTVFMTMEYLAGESLQKKMRSRGASRIDQPTAEAIVMAVARALQYAHGNHIVHGDLKPGNVIITDGGEVKVIDFGMARFIPRPGTVPERANLRRDASPKAVTPRYASPQMMAGEDSEPADDVYALACIAYEVLSGKHPFGRETNPGERDPQSRPPRPPGLAVPQYQALVRALAFERKDRTPTVQQFVDEYAAAPRMRLLKRWLWIGLALAAAAILYLLEASWQSPGFAQTPMHPVACVSWNDAAAFTQWLFPESACGPRTSHGAARAGDDKLTRPSFEPRCCVRRMIGYHQRLDVSYSEG
jgi:predicted Ser/Thr protein kinase